jgi:hypothetical protein
LFVIYNQLKNSKSFGIILAQTLTAIELWLVACIGFLFMSLIELGLIMQAVTLLDRDEKKRKKKKAKYSFTNALFNRGRDKEVVLLQ